MPFRSTYTEILEMIHKGLLDTGMCRTIMRRAGVWPESGQGAGPDIRGTFSEITPELGDHYGNFYPEGETSFYFPDGSESMALSTDFTGYTQARLLVTTVSFGRFGSVVTVAFDEGEFIDTAPSTPLDDTGLHVSEWCEFSPIEADVLRWIITNPDGGGGGYTLGLCQLQLR